MNKEQIYWVSLPYATFGIITDGTRVILSAPIAA